MSLKRKLLRVLMLVMLGGASFVGAKMNPKEIEDVLHIMNETKVEFRFPIKTIAAMEIFRNWKVIRPKEHPGISSRHETGFPRQWLEF